MCFDQNCCAARIDNIQETVVDYETLRRHDDPCLTGYLSRLAAFDPTNLATRQEQLAFWLVRSGPTL